MVQKHRDVDRSRAVVAELDQLIHRRKSHMNTNVWIEKVRCENNIADEVNKRTDSVGEHILVEPSDNKIISLHS
jgi:hypothetical protein